MTDGSFSKLQWIGSLCSKTVWVTELEWKDSRTTAQPSIDQQTFTPPADSAHFTLCAYSSHISNTEQ